MQREVHHSSESDEWATPPELLRRLDRAVGGFDGDAASGAEQKSIADTVITQAEDGLTTPWPAGVTWCNPPYSDVADWVQRGRAQAARDDVETVVMLVAARTSTDWFQSDAAVADRLCFIDGRLRFGDAADDAPFPSALLVFGAVPEALDRVLDDLGVVYRSSDRVQASEQATLDNLGGDSR
jgi:phage N-6-adenine-methyltransferase